MNSVSLNFKYLINPLKCFQRKILYNVKNAYFISRSYSIKSETDIGDFTEKLRKGPSLQDFLKTDENLKTVEQAEDTHPYINPEAIAGVDRKVYIQTYGCQMNVNDTEIIWAILEKAGFSKVNKKDLADVILVVTCAIREGAEQKIWHLLDYLKSLKRKRKSKFPLKVGVLGCMAERLKTKLLEVDKAVDIVAGPDSYRDLPRLLSLADNGQEAVNVILSLEETYADIMPVRINPNSPSAFVSIMRGCDNLCSYCIVPFTRGRERSRSILSILNEIKLLSDQGVKEITLLGQNVNSYRDTSETNFVISKNPTNNNLAKGFRTLYKPKPAGLTFAHLLEKVSQVNPNMRIRFTSPHPKDFPDEVLEMIRDHPNICNSLHLPAQSGNTEVLERMRRGYTREAYIDLVNHIRDIIPDVTFTSDFITGFCGETEAAHQDTISLIKLIKYNYIYSFPYSMREKTRAYHRLNDDVPNEIKLTRLREICDTFRPLALELNQKKIGTEQLVLVEGFSKRSNTHLVGRTDGNIKVILPQQSVRDEMQQNEITPISIGNYVAVKIEDCSSQVLHGTPLYQTNIENFYRKQIKQKELSYL